VQQYVYYFAGVLFAYRSDWSSRLSRSAWWTRIPWIKRIYGREGTTRRGRRSWRYRGTWLPRSAWCYWSHGLSRNSRQVNKTYTVSRKRIWTVLTSDCRSSSDDCYEGTVCFCFLNLTFHDGVLTLQKYSQGARN